MLRRIFEKFLLYLALFLVRVVPFRKGYHLGNFYFLTLWPLLSSERKRALGRMEKALKADKKTCEEVLKKSFKNLAYTMVEVFYMNLHGEKFLDLVKINKKGFSNLKSIKKGGVMITAHYGNWEIGGSLFAKYVAPKRFIAVGRSQSNNVLNDLALETRAKLGMVNLTRHWRDLAKISKEMKNGAIVGLVSDQHSANGVIIDFMGRKAKAFSGAFRLSSRFGCFSVVTVVKRLKWGEFEWLIEKPLSLGSLDEKTGVQAYSDRIAEIIKKDPTQWLWLHNRWKVD